MANMEFMRAAGERKKKALSEAGKMSSEEWTAQYRAIHSTEKPQQAAKTDKEKADIKKKG